MFQIRAGSALRPPGARPLCATSGSRLGAPQRVGRPTAQRLTQADVNRSIKAVAVTHLRATGEPVSKPHAKLEMERRGVVVTKRSFDKAYSSLPNTLRRLPGQRVSVGRSHSVI